MTEIHSSPADEYISFPPPFDRESDALRIPGFLSPRIKPLNGIWLTNEQCGTDDSSFFSPDFQAENWTGIPVPFQAERSVRTLCLLREFELDVSWLKRKNGIVLLRFEDAGHSLSVWINGTRLPRDGKKEAPAAGFDISALVHKGVNRIAVRLRRTGKDVSEPLGLRRVLLILQPSPGLLWPEIRLDGEVFAARFTVCNDSEEDRLLTLNVKLLGDGRLLLHRFAFRKLFVKAKSRTEFALRRRMPAPDRMPGSVSAALLSLVDTGHLLDCRLLPAGEAPWPTPLPFPEHAPDIPIHGPHRDPVSLEDDGEHLWLSATSGLLACFGRDSGTVESLDLDGISLLDRGPLPPGRIKWSDITLDRKRGQAELETRGPGLRICWGFHPSGRIRVTADREKENGELILRLPPHLERLVFARTEKPVPLPEAESGLPLPAARVFIFTGALKAGIALLLRAPVQAVWRKHRHDAAHCCGCGEHSAHGGSELLLKAPGASLDLLILPFAANSIRFDDLFTQD